MHRLIYVTLLTATITLSSFPAFSQSFNEGFDAYEEGDYSTALDHFRPLAEQGDPESQYLLGEIYEKGEGVHRDVSTALLWFQRAAEQDHAVAMRNIGFIYVNGKGETERNLTLAYQWWKRAAEKNDDYSQYLVAHEMYSKGQGTPQNFSEAAKWYRRSAEQGNISAQAMLATMYDTGRGVSQNPIIAYVLANIAVALGYEYFSDQRDSYLEKLNSEQITEAQRISTEWKIGTPLPTSEDIST